MKSLSPKMKKRTKFTILAVVNLTWYTVVVLIAKFFDYTVSPELTVANAKAPCI